VESLLEVHLTARRADRRRGARVRFRPGLLLWALLLLLAVPALALAETEAPPAPTATDTPALLDDGTQAPVENYGTLPNGEEEITFEPTQSGAAPAGTVETPPVTAPSDPGTSPAPVDQTPTTPVDEGTTTPPADPADGGTTPPGEPVDETPVGSVIDQSPEQEPTDGPVYTPPVTAFPSVEIPVPAADPLPTTVIPTDLGSFAQAPVPPAAETPAPPASSPVTPIVRPPHPVVTPAVTIPGLPTPAHPANAPKPESQFTTGADLVAAASPIHPAATSTRRETVIPAPGLDDQALANPFTSRIESPTGSLPGGSQLFQVLAQYVMAGGSGPPTGVALLLLVQLATVIGAFAWRTPRSMSQMILGVADKIFVGYRAVALRPG
jgi:hypothetical protein